MRERSSTCSTSSERTEKALVRAVVRALLPEIGEMCRLGISFLVCVAIVVQSTAAVLPHVHDDCRTHVDDVGALGDQAREELIEQRSQTAKKAIGSGCLACTVHGPMVTTLSGHHFSFVCTEARLSAPAGGLLLRYSKPRQHHLRGPPLAA